MLRRSIPLLLQASALLVVVWLGHYFFTNVQANLAQQNIAAGFGFLEREAGFEISQSLVSYSSADPYWKALYVGFLNTVLVAGVGIVMAILLGALFGITLLSRNPILAGVARCYVEVLRNVPILLQLFFWYALVTETFPLARNAFEVMPSVYLSNKGLVLPWPKFFPEYQWVGLAAFCGFAISLVWQKWAKQFQEKTGQHLPMVWVSIFIVLATIVVAWLWIGAPFELDSPMKSRFGFRGGLTISPEFFAVLLGLGLYTSAYIAEIVRGGIQSVNQGQREAAEALGLSHSLTMRLIILPQALRVIIPPLTSQMLNLTKNSSLAVAIGYPDLVNVSQTTLNQTGQAIEAIAILMTVYLSLSLSTSFVMNWYNSKAKLVER